ncbi:hypothetical protein QCA50_003776 [Cerrena zonata]|uniref:C2 domain-containing protein n=1 Tax=Cerrena zonata TaxID=2478898 RepID=A0AAW0GQD4_9APHY
MGLAHGYLYTCEVSINRATDVPISDLNNLSSDPYVRATLSTKYGSSGHSEEQHSINFRTHTERRTLNPVFNEKWVVSGIPSSGFTLTLNVRDEDPGNHDDQLGKSTVVFPSQGQQLNDEWSSGEVECKVHKRKGNLKSKLTTYGVRMLTCGGVEHHCRLWIRVRVLSRAENQDDKRVYTLGPQRYFQHFSPMLGFFLGSTKAPNTDHSNPSLKPSTFVANRFQLTGPVPASLRHRYVGFAPFVKAMFRKKGIEGILLHRALHKQHCSMYKWDKNVVWGTIEGDEDERNANESKETKSSENIHKSLASARQFLKMTSHGTHGRLFTYVIMLDGEWRFTETGTEFAIGLLSKHTMHSDVSLEIAYSGEFFVRQVHSHENDDSDETPPSDPSEYELVIDNDSGTYRPKKELLPTLQSYLSLPSNLGALGKITAMDGFDEKLKKWKKERADIKNTKEKGRVVHASLSESSSSSASSSSVSVQSVGLGDAASGQKIKESDVQKAVEEDAKRARENCDEDQMAKGEEHIVEEARKEEDE